MYVFNTVSEYLCFSISTLIQLQFRHQWALKKKKKKDKWLL